MLKERLEEIKALVARVTQGEWKHNTCFGDWSFPYINYISINGVEDAIVFRYGGIISCMGNDPSNRALNQASATDSKFVAEARTIVSELCEAALVWHPIETVPKNKSVLVTYVNRCGNRCTVKARYIPKFTEKSSLGEAEYCEEKDEFYVSEGWYEEIDNWGEYSSVLIYQGEPTHWCELPKYE